MKIDIYAAYQVIQPFTIIHFKIKIIDNIFTSLLINFKNFLKMKHVLGTSQVAHVWANQLQQDARNSHGNFFFEGKTIYSYGRHFPIAVLTGENNHYCLFTTRSYSNTTTKHIYDVRRAASHKEIIYCFNPDEAARNNHERNINQFFFEIDTIAKNLENARKPEKYFSQIESVKDQLNKYCSFFKIKLTKAQKNKISFTNAKEYKEAVIKANAAFKRENAAKYKLGQKVYTNGIAAWKEFKEEQYKKKLSAKEQTAYYHFVRESGEEISVTNLRTNCEVIQTTKHIELPVNVAKRYYDFYKRIVSKGGCKGNCNYKMLEYEVSEASKDFLVVGCHNIPASEIKEIAAKLNWL